MRFPNLTVEIVDEALQQPRVHFADRPLRDFIPFLVERAATTALRKLAEPSNRMPRPAATPARTARELQPT